MSTPPSAIATRASRSNSRLRLHGSGAGVSPGRLLMTGTWIAETRPTAGTAIRDRLATDVPTTAQPRSPPW